MPESRGGGSVAALLLLEEIVMQKLVWIILCAIFFPNVQRYINDTAYLLKICYLTWSVCYFMRSYQYSIVIRFNFWFDNMIGVLISCTIKIYSKRKNFIDCCQMDRSIKWYCFFKFLCTVADLYRFRRNKRIDCN